MNIIEKTYNWNGSLSQRKKTTRIIIHHAAAVICTADDIHRWHLNNGWCGIGYHFFVRKDGTIYRGRPENMVGAHAGNNNSDSIGICFEGNYQTETSMPSAQKIAGRELVAYLKKKYSISKVQKHKDVNSTACPGKYFPFDYINSANTTTVVNTITVYKPTVQEWQKAAVSDGYSFSKYGIDGEWGGECESIAKKAICQKSATYKNKALTRIVQRIVGVSVDGKFGSQTRTAVKLYQAKNGLEQDGIVGINTWKKMLGV